MQNDRPRLPDGEFERIYSHRIRPDLLDGSERSKSPTAVLVADLPGVGSAYIMARIHANLARAGNGSAVVSDDQLREYHPYWRAHALTDSSATAAVQPDIRQWSTRLVTDAAARKVNLLLEVDVREAAAAASLARRLRRDGYQVAAVALAIERESARQLAIARYALAHELGLTTRVVAAADQDAALDGLRLWLSTLEQDAAADRVQLIAPDGRQLYANEMAQGHWVAEPRATYAVDDFTSRRPTARELADSALRWHALAHCLAADAAVPAEASVQAAGWRDEAVAKVQGDPESQRLLALGHEAQAFRTLHRVDFQRDYPQHAKAVERLQEAIDYAEKQFEHAADRERFIEQARGRLADRIAEGRSFAAGRSKPKAPEPPPRTR